MRRVTVYQHSDLLYWWVVWAYGFVCALLTLLQGAPVSVGGAKPVLVHPSPWLGISFCLLVVFVLVSTSAKARGMASLALVLIVTLIVAGVERWYGWERLLPLFWLLLVYMNLAFYILVSSLLFVGWFTVTFGVERLMRWTFTPGGITIRSGVMEAKQDFVGVGGTQTRRLGDDILVHKGLGLGFLGFGTGDLEIRFNSAVGPQRYELRNVWRATKVEREIVELMGKVPTVGSP